MTQNIILRNSTTEYRKHSHGFMKKACAISLMTTLVFGLTACGSATATSTPTEDSADYEYVGEGQTTGGIPTDEELANREAEYEQYEAEATESTESTDSAESTETTDYSDVNVEMETTPTASDTFISSDNFWQGDDYFDLEEYLWMNGATSIDYDNNYTIAPYMFFGKWRITIRGTGLNIIDTDAWNSGNRADYNIIVPKTESDSENGPTVQINDSGARIYPNIPALLDAVIPYLTDSANDPLSETGLDYSIDTVTPVN